MPNGPLCKCGCNEHLPAGSTRNYKRGHRQRVNRAESRAMDIEYGMSSVSDTPKQDDLNPFNYSFIHEDTDSSGDYDAHLFNIYDAAESTEDDPDSDIWSDIDPTKDLPIRALKDIEGKLAFMMAMPARLLSVMDPVCGGALVKQSPVLAHTLTPIIAQSPGMVKWFSKTSNIILYLNLGMAMWPVLAAIWTHHLAPHEESGVNDFVENGQMNIDPNMYTVR